MDRHMGHAAHFLERVDRLDTQHAELALGLYRDHELLRILLKRVALPEGAERVAVALSDTAEGPYVIVNRQGKFITCLGRGMRVFDAPIVKRAQLDEIARHVDALRVLLRRVEGGASTERDRHLDKVLTGRGNVTREEFDDLVSWAPLLYPYYVHFAFQAAQLNRQARQRLSLAKRVGPRDEALLKTYCESAWAQLHLCSLIAATPASLNELYAKSESAGSMQYRTWFSHELMGLMTWPGIFRGALFGTWLKELVLPAFEQELANIKTYQAAMHGMITAYAAYRRDPGAHGDMLNVLKRVNSKRGGSPLEHACAGVAEALLVDKDAPADTMATRLGLQVAQRLFAQTHPADGEERVAALPDSDKRALLLGDPRALSLGGRDLFELIHCLVEACALGPRDFYVSTAHRAHQPWSFEEGMRWLRPQLESDLKRKLKPIHRAHTPGRNEACPCGSGKKVKRCCGTRGSDGADQSR